MKRTIVLFLSRYQGEILRHFTSFLVICRWKVLYVVDESSPSSNVIRNIFLKFGHEKKNRWDGFGYERLLIDLSRYLDKIVRVNLRLHVQYITGSCGWNYLLLVFRQTPVRFFHNVRSVSNRVNF